jgi:hypothetical protein
MYGKMFSYFQYKQDEYMAHYHKRSNVESTFSMVKRKFGDSVRSKNNLAMRNFHNQSARRFLRALASPAIRPTRGTHVGWKMWFGPATGSAQERLSLQGSRCNLW